MFRLFFLTFSGEAKPGNHAHESPAVMTLPMIVLAVLAVIAGFINTPGNPVLGTWLTHGFTALPADAHGGGHAPFWVTVVAVGVSLAGIVLAWLMYGKRSISTEGIGGPLYQLSFRKYYIDEMYDAVFVKPLRMIGKALHLFDVWVIDGLVRLVAAATRGIGSVGARMQNGQIQTYGAIAFIGLALLLVALTIAGGYVEQWRTIFLQS
jgi:NADH-quinone oxidoreductase subunit L